VDPASGACTCPDHEIRGETCKHLRRVAIEINTGRTPPPGRRQAICAACGVAAFVPADGPPLCDACRVEAGDVVVDHETGDRLVVAAVTDRRADAVRVDGTDLTVAAYPTNDGYPDDDPVVEATYLTDAVSREDPTRYSFPISRLERTDAAVLE